MISKLKAFSVSMVAGGNIATVIIMLLMGFADYVNPVSYPTLSCLGLAFPVFLLINLLCLVFWLIFKWRMALIPIA
ncbi:MAG: AP endonuclease, partial [Prevotella sp.]